MFVGWHVDMSVEPWIHVQTFTCIHNARDLSLSLSPPLPPNVALPGMFQSNGVKGVVETILSVNQGKKARVI